MRGHVQRELVRTTRKGATCRPRTPEMSRGGGVQEMARKWGDTWDGGKPLLSHKGQGRGRQDKSPWRTGAQLVLLTGPASRAQRRAGSDSGAHAEEHATCGLARALLALRPTPSISPGNQVITHALERMKDGRSVFTARPCEWQRVLPCWNTASSSVSLVMGCSRRELPVRL